MNDRNIRLLGVSGSPRLGATDFIVRAALNYAKDEYRVEVDYFTVRGKKLNFCVHCDYCIKQQKGCVHKDDMRELYPKLEWANAWLVGSPVYQGDVSGQLKTVLDRCRAMVAKNPKVFENKIGAAVAVGGDRNGGQEPAIRAITDFYIINEMIPVGGGAFGANLGGTVWSRDQGAQGAEKDRVGMETVFKTIDRLIRVTLLVHR